MQKPDYGIGFAQRRLSILDLSQLGHQPMLSKDEKVVITYNGEVYNFLELRDELEQKGHVFRSNCDTEVIIAAYQEWGCECFQKFNGMFAIAIYDEEQVKYSIAENDFYMEGKSGIIEMSATILGNRWRVIGKLFLDNWLFYRWFCPTYMTYLEMRSIIKELKEQIDLVMMFHSMEIMVNKMPYVKMKWMQGYYLWRLRKALGYAVRNGYTL